MFSPTVISTIATLLLCSASPARGLPQATNAVSTSKAIFQRWSSHPDCSAPDTACKGDCTQAVKNLCQKKLGLNEDGKTNYIAETVGECTATYIYELGNTLPDETKCYNTFAYINDEGKPGPDGCGGYFGGVLGWDEKGNRTLDPIYAIQPKSGNPNCFMPPGKEADKPLAMDELPGGTKFEVAQCPMAISRRGPFGDNKSCTVGSSIWFGSCSVVCMAVVASASSWW
ncbi:MAG: hypothetical protein L6R41_004191 [Letrouitia leprolyta]|nr:MAG: hypothetical protein L6R41_004191 [Letrouitia leprolyta]